jgi:hypothetical protein
MNYEIAEQGDNVGTNKGWNRGSGSDGEYSISLGHSFQYETSSLFNWFLRNQYGI